MSVHDRKTYGRLVVVEASWNVTAHAQKPDFVFRRNGRVNLNRGGLQFSRLLAAEVCASAVVMLDTPCSEVVWRVLATHSIRQFPLHFRVTVCHHISTGVYHWFLPQELDGGEWLASCASTLSETEPSVPVKQDRLGSEPVWVLWREKSVAVAGNQTTIPLLSSR